MSNTASHSQLVLLFCTLSSDRHNSRTVHDPISPRAWRVLREEYLEVDFPRHPVVVAREAIYIRKEQATRTRARG